MLLMHSRPNDDSHKPSSAAANWPLLTEEEERVIMETQETEAKQHHQARDLLDKVAGSRCCNTVVAVGRDAKRVGRGA